MLSWGTYYRERPSIEADLTVRATEALGAGGQSWAKVTMTGRDAVITGRAQKDGEPKAALDIVRGVWGVRTAQLKTDLAGQPVQPERIGPPALAPDDAAVAARKAEQDAQEAASLQKAKEEAEAAAAAKAKEEAEAAAALKAREEALAAEAARKAAGEAAAVQRAKEQTEAAMKAQAEAEAALKAEEEAAARKATEDVEAAAALKAREEADAAAQKEKEAAEAAAASKAKEEAETAARKAEEEAAARAKQEAEAAAAQQRAKEEAEAAAREAEALAAQKAKQEADMAAEAKADAEAKAAAEAEAKQAAEEDARRAARKTTAETEACEKKLTEAATEDVILFERASADINSKSARTIRKLAAIIKTCPGARVEVEGHTDSEGTDERNQNLSERRARAVVAGLVQTGVAEDRLSAVGFGAGKPVASNTTKAGMAKNRRIEFKVFTD